MRPRRRAPSVRVKLPENCVVAENPLDRRVCAVSRRLWFLLVATGFVITGVVLVVSTPIAPDVAPHGDSPKCDSKVPDNRTPVRQMVCDRAARWRRPIGMLMVVAGGLGILGSVVNTAHRRSRQHRQTVGAETIRRSGARDAVAAPRPSEPAVGP